MPVSGYALTALLWWASAVHPAQQPRPLDAGTRQICSSVESVEIPEQDRPGPDDARALAGCVSVDLYYGLGVPRDPEKARKCAYVEMAGGDPEPPLGGKAMLMMVYANGLGATRNFDVALKLACSIGGAAQDVAGSVNHLARLRAAHWTGDGFSICDHSSGPTLYKQCAELQERFDAVARATALDSIVSTWPLPSRQAFEVLRRAAEAFFSAHARNEANLEVTLEVQERAFLEDALVAALRQFERGDWPRSSADDRRRAEARMDAAYARTQRDKTRRWGTATAEGIRRAQEAWTSYRDAWLAFGRVRFPAAGADGWRTWLAEQRADMLERFPQ